MPAKKYIELSNTSGLPTERSATAASTGATNAGDIVALDDSGRLDNSLMPVGIGTDTKILPAFEALAAGDLVNVFNDSGTSKVRKADASAANAGKRAQGFVLASVTAGGNATVYFEGTITGLSALSIGSTYFLSNTNPGAAMTTVPTTAGHSVQNIGVAISATEISFEPQTPFIRG